ncbi:Uu.00g127750.m01.CDS01 [Anthostomella pinea]|uniref:Uu.00g127750.m01.CDS01 n=1 Tax=Anthostomella pinea TaxID=933095 RepID=A0AAI8VIW8_9PEZI|nr:Uu.00g127750.m01.CDS01 [Anthostomella pinea]
MADHHDSNGADWIPESLDPSMFFKADIISSETSIVGFWRHPNHRSGNKEGLWRRTGDKEAHRDNVPRVENRDVFRSKVEELRNEWIWGEGDSSMAHGFRFESQTYWVELIPDGM